MDTAEMRLLTVPQFARRVRRSEDEVLALIQSREVKALRPEAEGGYRVLETEVDRLLQERTTRIRPERSAASQTAPQTEGRTPRTVDLETHLATVTRLERAEQESARWERLSLALQTELFQYRHALEENEAKLFEARAVVESQREEARELKRELQECRSAPWWRRLFGKA